MDELVRKVSEMSDGNETADILGLLQAYLPNMNKGDSGLGSEMNSWNR